MRRASKAAHGTLLKGVARHGTPDGLRKRQAQRTRAKHRAIPMKDQTIQAEVRLERLAAAAAHPLAELLDCSQEAGTLLTSASRCIDFEAGEVVFQQDGECKGLYVVVSGDFARKAERFQMRVTLGSARTGDLLELAAALGDGRHTYTLSALTPGSLLMLPIDALHRAFDSYPPLRMKLLEELAREVSRAYITCCLSRIVPARRHSTGTALSS
jgi:CRP-like cAMP-binding protein